MPEYSELLRRYMKEKDIKIDKLTQYCGVERSSMYKILNGKRKVTKIDIAKKIANYMQLSPVECEQYYEAYYRSMAGERAFEENRQMEDFILHFDEIYYEQSRKLLGESNAAAQEQASSMVCMLNGKVEIDYYIRMILDQAVQRQNPRIYLMMQCDNQFLKEILLMLGKNRTDMRIEHILCFQKNENQKNMEILKQIIPFYACDCQYIPFYYYDEISAHFYNMNLFCNVIICDEAVLCYTSDYTYGQLLRKEEFVKAYQDLFQTYQSHTYPLLSKVKSVIEEYLFVGQDVLCGMETAKAYSLHAEPCAIPFISREILEKQLVLQLPHREQLIEMFENYILEEKEMLDQGKLCCSFTLNGLERFIREGRQEEIPEDFYYPIETSDCIKMVTDMLPYFQNGAYRIMKNRLSDMNSKLHIFMSPAKGHLLFQKKEKELVYININEPGMIQQFMSFLQGMNEEICLYTADEAVEKVKEIIERYV